jgi:dTDP-4-amino-4,6-dideoxygalactose transaminase
MENIWDTVEFFEKEVAAYCGSKYAVAVDSCSNALFLTFKYLSTFGIIDEVQVPKKTYLSVPMSVMHAGYKVKFVDHDWVGDYKLEPYPVVDSACRFEKDMYRGGYVCLSFHFKKLIPIGKGGMILTDDAAAVQWLCKARYDGRASYYYNDILTTDVDVLGYHMYMTPEQAARGIEQFYRAKSSTQTVCGAASEYAVDLSQLKVFNV